MNYKNLCKTAVMPCVVAFGMMLTGCTRKWYIVTSNRNNELGFRAMNDAADTHTLKYDGVLRTRFYSNIRVGDTIVGYARVLDRNTTNGIGLEIHSVNGHSLLEYEESTRRDSVLKEQKASQR